MKTIIIVPAYNEKENLRNLVQAIKMQNIETDILFVDDNSPDGTSLLAEELASRDSNIKVLHREKKQGIGQAYQEGFPWALRNGYDFLRDRYYRGISVYNWSFKRLLLSKFSNDFIRILSRLHSADKTKVYKCFRKEVLEFIDLMSCKGKQNAFLIELVFRVIRSGFRTAETPFVFRKRRVQNGIQSGGRFSLDSSQACV